MRLGILEFEIIFPPIARGDLAAPDVWLDVNRVRKPGRECSPRRW